MCPVPIWQFGEKNNSGAFLSRLINSWPSRREIIANGVNKGNFRDEDLAFLGIKWEIKWALSSTRSSIMILESNSWHCWNVWYSPTKASLTLVPEGLASSISSVSRCVRYFDHFFAPRIISNNFEMNHLRRAIIGYGGIVKTLGTQFSDIGSSPINFCRSVSDDKRRHPFFQFRVHVILPESVVTSKKNGHWSFSRFPPTQY